MMRFSANGKPSLDFMLIDELIGWLPAVPETSRLFWENSPMPTCPQRGEPPILIYGAMRGAMGDGHRLDGDIPRLPMIHICSFCHAIALLMHEGGVEFGGASVNLQDKPDWFKHVNDKLETPTCGINGRWVRDSDPIRATICDEYPQVAAIQGKPWASQGIDVTDPKELKVKFPMIGLIIAGSSIKSPMRSFLVRSTGVDPDGGTPQEVAADVRNHILTTVARFERTLGSHPYLCGASPGGHDCLLVGDIEIFFTLNEYGVVDLGFNSFEDLKRAFPTLWAYRERWGRRESFVEVYGEGDLYRYNQLCTLRTFSAKVANMHPDIDCKPALDRARAVAPAPEDIIRMVKKEKKRRPSFTKTHSRRNSVLEIKESISKMNGGLCL